MLPLHWAHRRLLHQFARSSRRAPAACSASLPLSSGMVASAASQSPLEMLPFPRLIGGHCFTAAPPLSFFTGLTTACPRALRGLVRPTGCAVSFALIGSSVPACASLARHSGAADAFGVSALQFLSLLTATACFAHCARPSCGLYWLRRLFGPSLGFLYRPALRWPGIPGLRTPLGVSSPSTPSASDGYGLFRAPRAGPSCALWSSVTATPPPFTQGRLRGSAAIAIVPLTKRPLLIPVGAVGVSRLRGFGIRSING